MYWHIMVTRELLSYIWRALYAWGNVRPPARHGAWLDSVGRGWRADLWLVYLVEPESICYPKNGFGYFVR